jgi:ABC-type bacteriocin/lantibiotic exporter with double-glycine peptidase domain
MNKIINLFDYNLKLKFIFLIFFMIIASFLELMGLGLVILILNSFLGLDASFLEIINNYTNHFLKLEINFEKIIFLISFLFTVKLLILILVAWMESDFLASFREKISNKLYYNFLNRDVKILLKKNSAEYIRNFTEEIPQSIVFITSCLKIILDSILILTFLGFLMYFNPTITVSVYIFFSILGLIYYSLVKNKLSNWATISLENRKKKIQFISESFLSIKSIKILARENFFLDNFKKQIQSISRILFKVAFLAELPRNFFEYILLISILFLFYYLIHNQYTNESIIQLLSIYTIAAFRLVPIMNRFLGHMQRFKHSYPSIKKLIIENEQKIIPKKNKISKINFKKNIILNIKKFSFNNNQNFLIKDATIDIKKNSQIGLIGDSGSGKSTIIDILCGFQQNKYSKLKVDGSDIFRSGYLDSWQNSLGYVPQNIIILNQSLRENILFGADRKIFNDDILISLLKKVDLENFLKKSKYGLSKILRQDGQNISGGEKQRIGIARALINNPELIILDEATSGLDFETENNILKTIKKFKKTSIIVSHRLNALKNCDKVYVIKNKQATLLKKDKLKKYFEKSL